MASSMVASRHRKSLNALAIKLLCTAHTDGTFDTKQITETEAGEEYWAKGFYLLDVWAVNDATTYPGSGTVTITDESGRQLIGAGPNDVLTLSTSGSGIGYLAAARTPAQRAVTSKLSVAVADTGSAANKFTLYIVLGRQR